MAKIPTPEMYANVVQLAIHAEAVAWNRLNNFLVGASFLVAAWATVFSGSKDTFLSNLVLYVICILGALAGLVWSRLGMRSRSYVDLYNKLAKQIEEAQSAESGEKIVRPFLDTADIRPHDSDHSSSKWLMRHVPLLVAGLFVVMFITTLCSQLRTVCRVCV